MIPIIHNCFRQKSAYLGLPKTKFTLDTVVVTAVCAGQNFKRTKFDYSWQLHSHIFKGLENSNHIESSPYLQNILAYG